MSANANQTELPDFVGLKDYFDKRLTPGQRAELRRVHDPDDIDMIPAYYYLVKNFLVAGYIPDRRWKRVVFGMPYVNQSENTKSIGAQLAGAGIREARLFQMVRSEYPNDLLHLRRILQQVRPSLNWQYFGEKLYFWGKNSKRRILEEYFLST